MWGFFGTAACRPIVPLPQWVPLIHLQRRHAPHRHERPLLAKEVTIQGILLVLRNSLRYWVLLHAAKLGHGSDSFTSPPKEGMRRIFQIRLQPGLNPRTRVPEASILTTRPPKPSKMEKIIPQLSKNITLVYVSNVHYVWIKMTRMNINGNLQSLPQDVRNRQI